MKPPMAFRIPIAAAVAAAGLGYLAWLALVDPSKDFLRPAIHGDWMVPGYTLIKFKGAPVANDGLFDRSFTITNKPDSMKLSVTACRGFVMGVNDRQDVCRGSPGNWKRSVSVDIAPYLLDGTNMIYVRVMGTNSPPALLVEGPPEVRSGNGWFVRLIGRNGRFPVASPQKGEYFMLENKRPENRSPLFRHSRARLFKALCVFIAVFTLYALVPAGWKPWLRETPAPPPERTDDAASPSPGGGGVRFQPARKFLARNGLCLGIFLAVAIVQYRNALAFPAGGGFDGPGHLEYVRIMAAEGRVPLPTRGWQTYQPPLYYIAAADVYNLRGGAGNEPRSMKAVQIFTTTCGLFTLLLSLGLLSIMFPDRPRVRALGFAVAAFLPVHFCTNSMVTNEVFAGTAITLGLAAAAAAGVRKRSSWILVAAAGIACGAAMLSKFTGLFLFCAVAAWWGFRALAGFRNIRAWLPPLVFAGLTLAISGWFYHRNHALYGNMFIGNWDAETTFGYEQPPGYRTLGFYTRFGPALFIEPARTIWQSFWDGQYASLWADAHTVIIGRNHPRALPASLVPWLALLPTAGGLLGFAGCVRSLLLHDWDNPRLPVVLLAFFAMVGMIAFTMELPSHTTIHARFLLSLTAPAAVFAGLGLDRMAAQLGRLRWLLYANIAAIGLLVLYVYRV